MQWKKIDRIEMIMFSLPNQLLGGVVGHVAGTLGDLWAPFEIGGVHESGHVFASINYPHMLR